MLPASRTSGTGAARLLPVLFIGHGSPMNAIEESPYTAALKSLKLPRPKAILVLSAHWVTDGTYVQASARTKTIHDFSGFPEELNRFLYPAPGAPEYAKKTAKLLHAKMTEEWGFDHGAWSVLHHLFPEADIPVFQVSIDPQADHKELGKRLQPLRNEVLIIGSGNVVHNLQHMGKDNAWAKQFDAWVKTQLEEGKSLDNYQHAPGASLAADEHFLPLLYALAAAEGEKITTIYEGIELGSMSMRSIRIG